MAPMGQCCATGSLHTGTPTGEVTKVHGLDCYVAEAPNGAPKGVVVIIPDAFGWMLPNNRILADEYAKKGDFKVYLPDFMNGRVLPQDLLISLKAMSATGILAQLAKFGHALYLAYHMVPFVISCRYAATNPTVSAFMTALKENEAKDLPIGTAGFCWGGQFVTHQVADAESNRTKDGKRIVDCGFVAHPSFLTYPQDIEKVVLPYSVAASEHDPQMTPEYAKQTEEILKEKSAKAGGQGIKYEFVMYHGAHHGFAVRADEDEKLEAEAGRKAEEQAIDFFSSWFASPPP